MVHEGANPFDHERRVRAGLVYNPSSSNSIYQKDEKYASQNFRNFQKKERLKMV